MRVRLQNCQKRRKLLGPAQYRREDAVYVLLSNILEEERRKQAHMGKKSRHWWRLNICQSTFARRASSRTWFGTISLCNSPILAYLRTKLRRHFYEAPRKIGIAGPQRERKEKFCAEPLFAGKKKPQRLRKFQPETIAWTNKDWVLCITVARRASVGTLLWKKTGVELELLKEVFNFSWTVILVGTRNIVRQ